MGCRKKGKVRVVVVAREEIYLPSLSLVAAAMQLVSQSPPGEKVGVVCPALPPDSVDCVRTTLQSEAHL